MSVDSLARKIRGCIFDFDGTIIISEHVHMKAWEDLAQELRRDLPVDFLEKSVGMSDLQLVKILAKFWHNGVPEQEILERKREFYMLRCPTEASVVPGVVAAIEWLFNKSIPVAIATSSSRCEVEPVLRRLGILEKFRGICTVEDITHPKPAPEIYICAAKRLDLPPEDCLAFEDSIAGVTSARAAGCSLVTVETLYSAERLGPARLSIKDFLDKRLMGILQTIVR
jgi:HAD superfamily hydrolase (TIGR01509 family)